VVLHLTPLRIDKTRVQVEVQTPVPPIPRLVADPDGKSGSVQLTNRLLWKVGRSSKNEVVISDEMVSRSHAIIQRDGENHYNLIDLGSRNGSYVNGRRVLVPVALKNGDEIRFGSQHFTFENPLGDEDIVPNEEVTGETETQLLYSLRPTTVLVVDIRDFTGLAQRLDEPTLARTIGTWIDSSATVLTNYQSWCQKYIGDAIMAVWVESGDTPYAANKTTLALAALRRILQVTQSLQRRFDLSEPIRIGAGLETGYASIANLGSDAASDYTALGDCVNRAFRLESATKEVKADFLVGQEAYSNLKEGGADITPFQNYTVTLKGYEKPTSCYGISFDQLDVVAATLEQGDTGTTLI